jgi:hypothetical protein
MIVRLKSAFSVFLAICDSVQKTRRLCIINCPRESIDHLSERTVAVIGLPATGGACTWSNTRAQTVRAIRSVEHVYGLYIINQRQRAAPTLCSV